MSQKLLEAVIGLGLNEADELIRAAGYRYRVVHRDGNNYICTMDYDTRRVNLHIMDRKITEARLG